MLLRDAVIEAAARVAAVEDDRSADSYTQGWGDGVDWMLDLLGECDDLELDELT